ncbi:MAG: PEFG-CTERM sorting domain-containing protein [Thaumarchaeota archaeon]|nr:PEFG-CTERM sorting domain-containing protein [Nitrososphaerota archaeon]
MRFLLIPVLVFLISSCITVGFVHAQPSSFLVKDPSGQQTFNVNYNIDSGTVSNIQVNTDDESLFVDVVTTGNGTLTITLPRTLIDATANGEDDQFFVLIDGENVEFQELKSNTADRILTIPFSDGSQEIEIMGTQVVPEFGPIAVLVFVIAITSIIAISKTRPNISR